jgi:hypothetical protein
MIPFSFGVGMSRAESFISIFEGFKLGSLGAGKKVSREIISNDKEVISHQKKTLDISPLGKIKNSYVWRQNFDPEWISVFPKSSLNNIDLSRLEDVTIYATYSVEKRDFTFKTRKKFPKYIQRLALALVGPNHEKSDMVAFYSYLHKFEDKQTAFKWMDIKIKQVHQEGLSALLFPNDWTVEN